MKKVLLIILILIILILFLNENRSLTQIEKTIKESVLFIEKVIDVPFSKIQKDLEKINNKNNLLKKYESLKQKYENLKIENSKYLETKKELNSLKENLKIENSLIDYEIINSYVINRNINYFYKKLIIEKGKKSGIKKGDLVINSKGLIGKIESTTNNTSTVKLLTNLKISVMINDNYGILEKYENGYFIITGIIGDVSKNDIIYTTGLDGMKKGIKVGGVKKIITDKYNLSKKIYVKSFVNFDNIDYVMVIK